ncbi:hypothetical protein M673_19930 (plasmid) [Aureimonas sp. AU20]|nr:hypothetical protein M673_19930 [Aureimonas sp. AU20]
MTPKRFDRLLIRVVVGSFTWAVMLLLVYAIERSF